MASLVWVLLVPLGVAVFSIPFLICAYVIIAFVNQRPPDFNTYKTYWQWAIWAAGPIGLFVSLNEYHNAVAAVKAYEQGYRGWQAEKERDRLAAERRESAEAERRRLAQVERARASAWNERRQRVLELEAVVLCAQAQHAVETDFFGTGNPAALLADFRQHLARLTLADLGLLRESQHPVIRQIIGDGVFLPPIPPLKLLATGPA